MQLSEATGWAVLAALVAIPLCYYFWKRWDRPDKLTRQAIEEHRLTKEEEILWKERAEEREAIRKEQGKWVRSPEVEAPSDDTKSLALGVLDSGKTGPPGPPQLHNLAVETPVQTQSGEPVEDLDLDI